MAMFALHPFLRPPPLFSSRARLFSCRDHGRIPFILWLFSIRNTIRLFMLAHPHLSIPTRHFAFIGIRIVYVPSLDRVRFVRSSFFLSLFSLWVWDILTGHIIEQNNINT